MAYTSPDCLRGDVSQELASSGPKLAPVLRGNVSSNDPDVNFCI